MRTLGPGTLTIGQSNDKKSWSDDVSKIALTPKSDAEDNIPLLSGKELIGEATTTWTLDGTVYQDYTMESLIAWTWQHEGEELPFLFTTNDGGLTASGTVLITPLTLGGDVKKKNTADFSYTCNGKPTLTAAG